MTLSRLTTSLPALRLSVSAVPLGRLAASSLAIGGARRAYWSFRCARRSPYQYWITASPGQKAWERRGATGSGASLGGQDKPPLQPEEPDKAKKHAKETEARVQADEQRFLAEEWEEWEKSARRHADARLELLRKALERHPYEMMFGGREARGVWNPWKHGLGWGKMLERWGQRSRSVSEYVEARGGELAKRWGDGKEWESLREKSTREGAKSADAAVHTQQSEQPTVRKTETKDGRTIETEETKMNGARTIRMRETEEKNGRTIRIETTETSRSTTIPSVQSGDVQIDLITMRKVQRSAPTEHSIPASQPPPPPPPSQPPKKSESTDIPVKTFTPSKTTADVPTAGFASQEWLKREGFSTKNKQTSSEKYHPDPPPKPQSPAPKATYTSPLAKPESDSDILVPRTQSAQIQSVIDLWQKRGSVPEATAKNLIDEDSHGNLKRRLVYEPKETTIDDVDLLRASDIRAASGKIRDQTPKSSALEISERRNALASKFADSQRKFEIELRKEIIDSLKNNTIPTKSPLWALWMLYDHAGRKDYEEWLRKGKFSLKDPKELKEMHYLSRAFFEQMPTPREIFATGGSSLSRYIDANRASLALNAVQGALNRWHMEMQSVLIPRGVQPFSQEVVDNVRRTLAKYHIELRRQVLSGKGPQVIKTRDTKAEQRLAETDKILAKEVESTRAAMQQHEEKHSSADRSDSKADFVQWMPPGLQRRVDVAKAQAQAHRDANLSRELREIYEADYGKITPNHRQPARESELKTATPVSKAAIKPPQEQDIEGQRVVWDETEPVELEASQAPKFSTASSKAETPTILLTLARRTGELTTHPIAQWPILKAQLAADASPLDSPALCTFLQVASNPQQVLREVVTLQANGYRLTSGRKGCLVFQRVPSLDTPTTSQVLEPTKPVEQVEPTTLSTPEVAAAETPADIESNPNKVSQPPVDNPPAFEPTPIPSVTSNETPPTPPYISPTYTWPAPTQRIRRAEAVFSGRPASASMLQASDEASSTSVPPTSAASPPPPPPPSSNINDLQPPYGRSRRDARWHGRWRSHGRHHYYGRPRRRIRRVLGSMLRTALLMAAAAYVAGLWLEWRRERSRFAARYGSEALSAVDHQPGLWAAFRDEVERGEDAIVRWMGQGRVERERQEEKMWRTTTSTTKHRSDNKNMDTDGVGKRDW